MAQQSLQPSKDAPRLGGPASLLGRSIVAGAYVPAAAAAQTQELSFRAFNPATGAPLPTTFQAATSMDIDRAANIAWEAFYALGERPAVDRALLLEACADRIMDLGNLLLDRAHEETGLGIDRLKSERERTVFTLRLFADLVRKGEWVEAVIDHADDGRKPTPKPDLRRMLRPLGPVAVFGASNFPLAYSTAGGDTASALAAGCPVIVKGHPAHPGTGEMVARAIAEAVTQVGLHAGTFSFLQAGGEREQTIGQELVRHTCVRAVGFTGSFMGGMTLAHLGMTRPDPIPVFAEMSSVNPVFLLPGALETQAEAIAQRLFASITASAGQMCTCPGLIFALESEAADAFLRAMTTLMDKTHPVTMLSQRVRSVFINKVAAITAITGVKLRGGSPHVPSGMRTACAPAFFRTTYSVFSKNRSLSEECFGPSSILIICADEQEMLEAASSIQGSLTGSIFTGAADAPLVKELRAALEQRVGRLIYNGVPTGVEVAPAMVHGGPYPATNQPHFTAVGPMSIKRWCRPVCYQNAPEAFLPPELREGNPLKLRRMVDGAWK